MMNARPAASEREVSFWRRSRRLDRLVTRYVAILFVVLGIVAASFTALSYLDTQVRTYDGIRNDVSRLWRVEVDERASFRRYAWTGDPGYLEPYAAAHDRMKTEESSLHVRMLGEPHALDMLASFERHHAEWESKFAHPSINNRRSSATDAATALDKTLSDAMRSDISKIDDIYKSLSNDADRQRQFIRYASYIAILIVIAIVGTWGYVSERDSARREERLLRSVVADRDTASRRSEWRSKLIAILAHDFRTSLAVIQANAELLETYPEERWTRAPYRAIYKAVRDLSDMTEEALLMARISNDALVIKPEPLLLYDVISEAADRFAGQRNIDVAPSEAHVMGDRRYLVRVFDNLIGNAVKYSEGDIEVCITEKSPVVEVTVTDRGPGIEPDDVPYIFDEYFRSEDTNQRVGTGLGLFIVKKIVDAHGGTVSADSRPGEGTTMRISLRAAPMPEWEAEPKSAVS